MLCDSCPHQAHVAIPVRSRHISGCQVPDGTKPEAEWLLGVLKDSPGYDRCPVPAVDTLEQRSPYRPSFFMAAPRATKSVRPAHLIQIVSARFFPRKTGLEFHQTSRIVLHDPIYYRLGLHQSSGYPNSFLSFCKFQSVFPGQSDIGKMN